MKIHEKAKLYDELLKDYKQFLEDMEKFKEELESIPTREDILETKNDKDRNFLYYPMLCGTYMAAPFGLSIRLNRHESNLNWYLNQK
jgi:hypothetical protein